MAVILKMDTIVRLMRVYIFVGILFLGTADIALAEQISSRLEDSYFDIALPQQVTDTQDVFLSTANVSHEGIIKKTVENRNKYMHVFLKNNVEIARKEFNKYHHLVRQKGKIPDGIIREYYETGELQYEWLYRHGQRNGLFKGYFENGVLKGEYRYKNDVLEGESKEYYPNGVLHISVMFKNGLRHGPIKSYTEKGQLLADGFFNKGQKEGVFTIYYENGVIHIRDQYKSGKRVKRISYNIQGEELWKTDY